MTNSNVVKINVARYASLVKQGQVLLEEKVNKNWEFGELASRVDKDYGEDELGKFAKDIGVGKQFLIDCRNTLQKWPQKTGRPVFSIAKTLNAHPYRFKIVEKNPDITQREARAKMKEYNQQQVAKEEEEKPTPFNSDLYIIAREGLELARKANDYVKEAKREKKALDAIRATVVSWQKLLDRVKTEVWQDVIDKSKKEGGRLI